MLYFSKLLALFVTPVSLCLMTMLLGLVLLLTTWRRSGGAFIAFGLLVLWLSATPLVAGRALGWLEAQYAAVPVAETPASDAAVVLGGMLAQPIPPRHYLDMSGSIDRAWHAVRLYRAGKIKRIIIAAGNMEWLEAVTSEAMLIRSLLLDWNVPAEVIHIEDRSRTTFENAQNVRALVADLASNGKVLLVTSAHHMPRAMAVFARAGVAVIASPTDIRVAGTQSFGVPDLVPSATALERTSRAWREWLGLVYYRLRGWA